MKDYYMIADPAQKRLRIRVDGLIDNLPLTDEALTEWVYFAVEDLRDLFKQQKITQDRAEGDS